jgi:DNA-binding transcriptional regulator YiaG
MNIADAEAAWTAGRIRELRIALRLTQMEFAVAIGVTYSTINRWENAHSRPTALGVRRLEEMAAQMLPTPMMVKP